MLKSELEKDGKKSDVKNPKFHFHFGILRDIPIQTKKKGFFGTESEFHVKKTFLQESRLYTH